MKKRLALKAVAVLVTLWLLGGALHHGRVVCDYTTSTETLERRAVCKFEFRKR